MLKKLIAATLAIVVLNLFLSASVVADTKEDKKAKFVQKIKANITRLGTGPDSRLEVRLKDGTKLKGYLGQINENYFVVVSEKTGALIEIPYPQTKQVKGNNLSTGVKIAIGVAIGVAIVAILYLSARSNR